MSFLPRAEKRDLDSSSLWGSFSPSLVGPRKVTQLAPVYGAVGLIADLIASTPISVAREVGNGEEEPAEAPPWLTDPDPFLSVYDWSKLMVTLLQLRGNAFGLVDQYRRYVRWLPPEWVTVNDSNPLNPVYHVLGREIQLVKRGGNLIHLRNFVEPGRAMGLSPIEHFAATFDMATLASEYGRRWFRNASVPPGVLSAKTSKRTPTLLREARDDFVNAAKDGKPVALPGEWDYTKISLTAEEAQFLATIEASATIIATIYRLPPEDIGGKAGNSRTYSNREMDQELLNVRTLQPITLNVAAAFGDILPPGHKLRFHLEALAEPSLLDRARVDSEELKNLTLTPEEARRRRGRSPLTDAQLDRGYELFRKNRSESESTSNATSLALTEEAS